MAYEERSFPGAATESQLGSDINDSVLALTMTINTGWSFTGRFVVSVFDPTSGTNLEKMLCSGISGLNLTIVERGYDSTSPVAHSAGEHVRFVFDGVAAKESHDGARKTLGAITAKGDLLVGTALQQLAVLPAGTDFYPVRAHSGASQGVDYGPIVQAASHDNPDTDDAPTSLHHTLGVTANQAAAGDHDHTDGTPVPIAAVADLQASLDAIDSYATQTNDDVAALQALSLKYARWDKTGEPTIPNNTSTPINGWISVPIVNTLGGAITWVNDPQFVLAAGVYLVSASAAWEANPTGVRRIRILRDAVGDVESAGTVLAANEDVPTSNVQFTQDTGMCIISTDGSHFYTIFVSQTSGSGLLVKAGGGASHLQIVKLA